MKSGLDLNLVEGKGVKNELGKFVKGDGENFVFFFFWEVGDTEREEEVGKKERK